ncbi:unnamed protein product [Rotaria magnacalcarata]|uniref:Uncharacterized protein n=1 Tax=Rotaria magnacalcarata TaxID=392030 RepID=A0A816NSR2_9BILA|nr:unnamed protein product [Rotaria magnacalcarata]CAF4121611.1 unnamed protein product [Rotaria magnacalcarata]
MSGAAPWKLASAKQATTTNMNGSQSNCSGYGTSPRNTDEIITYMRINRCDFIWPVMAHNVAGLGDKYSQLQKLLSNVDLLLRDLKSDYSARRKRSTSPPPHLSPSQQPSKSPNITTNNELDQNRSK